jgi:bifunctional DNase/RNase
VRKIELKILGLSYSQSQVGSYIIVLSEKKGKIKLPIIIKSAEAQRIALEIEGIKSSRPMIYDMVKTMTDFYSIDIQEIFIHTLLEGVFYTKITSSNGLDEVDIECTAGDAIALSVIYKCPIFTTSEIIENAGIMINDDGTSVYSDEDDIDDFESEFEPTKRVVSIEDLEKMMQEALESEEYEIAAEIRDRINELKNNIK